MKNQLRCILGFSLVAFISSTKGNEGTRLPLGTPDLVPDERFDQHRPRETQIEPIRWTWDAKSVELVYEENDSTLGEFKFADQWSVAALQLENKRLKERVTELELRLATLEASPPNPTPPRGAPARRKRKALRQNAAPQP